MAAALVAAPLTLTLTSAYAADDDATTSTGSSSVLLSADFEDGTTGGLIGSGATGEIVTVDGNKAYEIKHRTQSYDGLETPAGLVDGLPVGTQVTLSMKVKLDPATTDSYSARWVEKPGYGWVSDNTALSATSWTTITGTYTVKAGDTGISFYTGTGQDNTGDFGYLLDDITVTDVAPSTNLLAVNFEDGTKGALQQSGAAGSVVTLSDGDKAYEIDDRTASYDGLETPKGLLDGLPAGTVVTLSMRAKLTDGTAGSYSGRWVKKPGYDWIGATTLSATGWTTISGTYTVASGDTGVTFYTGTGADNGDTFSYLIDDVTVSTNYVAPPKIQDDLTPIKDTLDFPVGAAVSDPQLTGEAGKLLAKHFDQVTPENTMKPEGWYDADHHFVTTNADADTLMQYAQDNDLRVYGHTLVWHSQTPDWFFQDANGKWLEDATGDQLKANQDLMRDRLKTHIDDVAKYLSGKFGAFGSDTNPLVAFDVVNEVVSDSTTDPDGLRQSHWYKLLGQEYIEDAFEDADQAFNHTYAAAGANRPVSLFINDYSTEDTGKAARLLALVKRLVADGVPVDGVGHQFHLTMATPLSSLKTAIDTFNGVTTAAGVPLKQAVTELDVPTGTPVTEANQIDQGYYYQSIFDMLRAEAKAGADIFSVTVWGLTDDQSWRADKGAPLLFDKNYQAKYAYYGVTDQKLPAKVLSAVVFGQDASDVTVADKDATSNVEWSKLPLHAVGEDAGFQLRWSADHLTAYVSSTDPSVDASDKATLTWGSATAPATATVGRDGTVTGDGVKAVVTSTASGWKAVVELPLSGLTAASTPALDVSVTNGGTTTGWNTPGSLGTLKLVEPLSFTTIPEAATAPTIDGTRDAVWADATTVTTNKLITGDVAGAKATVHQLWKGQYLYVLAEVTDPTVDVSSGDAYQQDSLEIFTDPGNAKNGSYRDNDAQMRISADNVASFGAGDEAVQATRLESATARTATGYVVEARIDLGDVTGENTFQGVDYEVNDGTAGKRTANYGWAEQTGTAYQTTERWGVAELVAATSTQPTQPTRTAPVVTTQPASKTVALNGTATFTAKASGYPTPTVTWQRELKGSKTWKTVSGARSTTLKVKATASVDGSHYRAVFTNKAGTTTSHSAALTVKAAKPAVTTQPRSVSGALGSKVKLTAKASGYPTPKVTWQRQLKGSKTWKTVSGAHATTLAVTVSSSVSGAHYRAVFTNRAGTVVSHSATVSVKAARPAITGQPRSVTVRSGSAASFHVGAVGSPAPRYQWWVKPRWSPIWIPVVIRGNGSTVAMSTPLSRDGWQVRVVVYNAKGATTSKTVTLHVHR